MFRFVKTRIYIFWSKGRKLDAYTEQQIHVLHMGVLGF